MAMCRMNEVHVYCSASRSVSHRTERACNLVEAKSLAICLQFAASLYAPDYVPVRVVRLVSAAAPLHAVQNLPIGGQIAVFRFQAPPVVVDQSDRYFSFSPE